MCDWDMECNEPIFGQIEFKLPDDDYESYDESFELCKKHYDELVSKMKPVSDEKTKIYFDELKNKKEQEERELKENLKDPFFAIAYNANQYKNMQEFCHLLGEMTTVTKQLKNIFEKNTCDEIMTENETNLKEYETGEI